MLYFFGLEILMLGIFLGLKFQACVFFGVCNMKLRRTPPSCILPVPPLRILAVCRTHVMYKLSLWLRSSLSFSVAQWGFQ